MTEPKNSITKQYQRLFEIDGVKLEFTEEALHKIANKSFERKTGARGLRAIMEAVMMDIMYEIPSDETIGICTITGDVVDGLKEPELVYRDMQVKKPKTRRLSTEKGGETA